MLALALAATGPAGGCGDDPPATPESTSPEQQNGLATEAGAETDEAGEAGLELTQIGSFDSPLYLTQPASGTEALYVVEQGGKVIRVGPDGESSTFLDLSGQVSSGGERGLLSIAFAPDFERSGLLYADYTDRAGDTRIVEYRSTDAGASVAPDSARELVRIAQPFENHNGGQLQFGPDRLLYIGTGDGGSAGDPDRNAQDSSSLLGKILRIDPAAGPSRPYSIPPGNPYADTGAGAGRAEIFALGLRNPWRFSFDRRTGALAIGDVGQDSLEEIDLVAAPEASGANFGWSAFEGSEPYNDDQQAPDAVGPALTYRTDAGDNCSVTGGYVVRDRELDQLYGRYLYGDFCAGELRSFKAEPGRPAADDRELGLEVEALSSFGEDAAGHVYAVSLQGPVYRLEPAA